MPGISRLVLRDSALLLLTLALWASSHHLDSIASPMAVPLALVAGGMIAVSGYLLHEWGHLLGALAGRSVVELPTSMGYLFLFKFDTGLNNRRQFLLMSGGGFLASGLMVWALFGTLSFTALADQIGLVLTVLGVLATIVLEFPPAWRVLRGQSLPQQGPAFINGAVPPTR